MDYEEYQRKLDDELLLIEARDDQLVPKAYAALHAELNRRGLSNALPSRMAEWREQWRRDQAESSEKRIWFYIVWFALLALMRYGASLMNWR